MSFNTDVVSAMQAAMLQMAATGAVTIEVDGHTVTFTDLAKFTETLHHYERAAAREAGKRPICFGIGLAHY